MEDTTQSPDIEQFVPNLQKVKTNLVGPTSQLYPWRQNNGNTEIQK